MKLAASVRTLCAVFGIGLAAGGWLSACAVQSAYDDYCEAQGGCDDPDGDSPPGDDCETCGDFTCCAQSGEACRPQQQPQPGCCKVEGAACSTPLDCCTDRCEGNKCLECAPTGTACDRGSECCSRNCEGAVPGAGGTPGTQGACT